MYCSSCRRSDRAIFARLLPGRRYLLLCGLCLDQVNAQIQKCLQDDSLPPSRHTEPVHRLYKPHHNRSRLAETFTVPVRMLVNLCMPAMRT